MSVRAKFWVQKVVAQSDGTAQITLQPVTDGSEENEAFYSYTPGGQIDLSIVNKDAVRQLVPGAEYYVDFTEAQPTEK